MLSKVRFEQFVSSGERVLHVEAVDASPISGLIASINSIMPSRNFSNSRSAIWMAPMICDRYRSGRAVMLLVARLDARAGRTAAAFRGRCH